MSTTQNTDLLTNPDPVPEKAKLTGLERATLGMPRIQAVPLRNDQGAITHQYDAQLGYVFDVCADGMFRLDFRSWNECDVLVSPEVARHLYDFLHTHFHAPTT